MNAPSDGGSGYSVRPEEVTKLGKKAEELGSRLVNLVRATAEESTAAAQAHQDWAFAGPLESLQRSCEHNIEGFGRWADDMGDRLAAAARNYEKTDDWALEKLRGTGV
ncbi:MULTISPECIES: type VII secretion target [unclassified Actinopolyspora]|uniref:type VII secretion target n=1 Tax=Actinopolyspora TaxID=1849 RepID=UPI0013F5B68A|nr:MULTISPECIES: type VII secretion target [unclassified Actinopolyspora]NHD18125.1 hypothetical protein [Actinopolyspora sp. BKK2]NHE77198.1 hypothetical protein [Actinopolyspora sp. BKK1]